MKKTVCAIVTLSILMGIHAFAQQQNIGDKLIRVREPRFLEIETPEYSIKRKMPNMSNINRQDWGQIYVDYRTALDWTDELTVTYYVLLQPKGNDLPKYKLLKGSVTYINIPKGDHKSVIYMHPTTIQRYGKPDKVAAVFSMNYKSRTGAIVPVQIPSDKSEWWKKAPVSAESGLLINRKDTPFAVLNDNAYEAQKTAGETE